MIVDLLDQILGPLPTYSTGTTGYVDYYSVVRYVIAGVVLLMLLSLVYRFFVAVFGRWLR